MVHTLIPHLLVGILLGFLSGLGVGGGSLLLLWLTLVLHLDPETARIINLMFFLPTALATCPFRWHQRTLHWRTVLPAALFGCLTAAVAAWIALTVSTGPLRSLFGVLLIGVGLKELFYRERNAR